MSHKSASEEPTNGTVPAPRRAGRPKGSRNRSTIDGRLFYGKHAKKLIPKLIKRAIEEVEKSKGNLDFAERVGKLAAASPICSVAWP